MEEGKILEKIPCYHIRGHNWTEERRGRYWRRFNLMMVWAKAGLEEDRKKG
jgi:hypothetical protein